MSETFKPGDKVDKTASRLKLLDTLLADARRDALEDACKAVCFSCDQKGLIVKYFAEPEFDSFGEAHGPGWLHKKFLGVTTFISACEAELIREVIRTEWNASQAAAIRDMPGEKQNEQTNPAKES